MARRRRSSSLAWALLISLLVNHGILLPGAYFLLFDNATEHTTEVVAVDLVEQPEPPSPQPELPAVLPPEQRQRALRPPRERVHPEQNREEEKQQQKKKREQSERDKELERQEPPEPPNPTRRMKMVEVTNPETKEPPKDARFLSDKNRQAERETRARETNLVKDHQRPKPRSRPNPRHEQRPGEQERRVAELRKRQAKKRRTPQQKKAHPLVSMRQRRRPRAPTPERARRAEQAPDGTLPAPSERREARELELSLDHRSHDRIYGEEAVRQRELARLSPSTSKGSDQKKWNRIRSSLENFIPEVQPGNQTALGTRAHPFALYIARMHRNIHRLWGYGFLVDLDNKPDSHQMNDMSLWTMIEIVILPNGEVEKATIVKTSGILPFDVAALDTVFSAGPYSRTPRPIRSADGKVYLHWRFHRNQRQCGTFGVDPYILTTPPEGPIDGDMSEVGEAGAGGRRDLRRLNRRGSGGSAATAATVAPDGPTTANETTDKRSTDARRAARAAAARLAAADDPGAARAVRKFLGGFQAGNPNAMAKACGFPFLAQGRQVATDRAELRRMLADLVQENDTRTVARVEVMTVMQARRRLGRVPPGVAEGDGMLVARTKMGRTPVTLLLQQRSGKWGVVGLNQ